MVKRPDLSGIDVSQAIGRSKGARKLIAVLYADMVGYSRLIGIDDVGTIDRLRGLRRDVIDPAIAKHGGRVVQTGGDSLLIVFDSIEGAVRCAVDVQQRVPQHDESHAADRGIRFRIGIDIGDAIADGIADDIITELSHSRSLFVIARNSSFTYKGRAVDIKQAAGELGVGMCWK